MPKNFIYNNISVEDFNEKYDSLKTINDKFEFIKTYILSYNLNGDAEFAVEDLIHNAKVKFAKDLADTQSENAAQIDNKVNPYSINPFIDQNSNEYKEQRAFLKNPIKFLSENAKATGDKYTKEEKDEELTAWRKNCLRIANYLGNSETNYFNREKERDILAVNKNACKEVYFDQNLSAKDALEKNKGKFFERAFRTTSKEYKAFEKAYKEFNDEDSHAYGDLEALAKATKAYVAHKIPIFHTEGDYLPDEDAVNRLTGTARFRVGFCVGVLKSIYAQHQRNNIDDLIKTEDILKQRENQADFQNDINNTVEDINNNNSFSIDSIDEKTANLNESLDNA